MKRFTLNDGRIRFGWVCFLLLAVFLGVIIRLGWLQIVRAGELRKQSENQLTADLTQKHPRGSIVDRDGEELAVSIMTGSLYVDPEGMSDDSVGNKAQSQRNVRRLAADLLAPVLKISCRACTS